MSFSPMPTGRGLSILTAIMCADACRAQDCRPFWTGLKTASAAGMVAYSVDPRTGPSIVVGSMGFENPVRYWNGSNFVPVGEGLTGVGVQRGLYVLDDGNGPCLYYIRVMPDQTRQMVRWRGPSDRWKPVPEYFFHISFPEPGGSLIPEFSSTLERLAGVYALELDGGLRWITRLEGREWKRLGWTSSGESLFRIADMETPSGPNLFVSGGFFGFDGMPARYLVRWDGSHWHSMGDVPGAAYSLITWDDGSGPSLYIGYDGLTNFPPLSLEGISRWTGTDWASVGGGLYHFLSQTGGVRDMKVFDDGSGPALFVVGRFDRAGGPNGVAARNIAKWDGQRWHALGAGVGFADYLAVADDGRGPSLFVSGLFNSCGGGLVGNIAQWVGCAGNRQCYADCDNNRNLNANDFACFMTRFAAKDPYANCDVSTQAPAINAADFACFLTKFAAGCP